MWTANPGRRRRRPRAAGFMGESAGNRRATRRLDCGESARLGRRRRHTATLRSLLPGCPEQLAALRRSARGALEDTDGQPVDGARTAGSGAAGCGNACEWAETHWIIPETGAPIVLRPWQRACLLAMFPADGSASPWETVLAPPREPRRTDQRRVGRHPRHTHPHDRARPRPHPRLLAEVPMGERTTRNEHAPALGRRPAMSRSVSCSVSAAASACRCSGSSNVKRAHGSIRILIRP